MANILRADQDLVLVGVVKNTGRHCLSLGDGLNR